MNFDSAKTKGGSEKNFNLRNKSEYDETESIKNKKETLLFKFVLKLYLIKIHYLRNKYQLKKSSEKGENRYNINVNENTLFFF